MTAELAELAVDQCELIVERFTLIAPDDYRHDLLEIKLFDGHDRELAGASRCMRARPPRRARPPTTQARDQAAAAEQTASDH